MNTHDEKNGGTRTQAVANRPLNSRDQSGASATYEDNRPAAVAQRKLQEMMDHAPRSNPFKLSVRQESLAPSTLTLQMYRPVAPEEYKLQVGKEETQAPFSVQTIKPPLTDVGDQIAQFPVYNFEAVGGKPTLDVSDDGTVAIQPKNEPKEFYATPSVWKTANIALEKKESEFRLEQKGHSIKTGENELQMISPVNVKQTEEKGASAFADFGTSVCRDITAKVIHGASASFEAIFQTAQQQGIANKQAPESRREIDTSGATESSRLKNLAGALPGNSANGALQDAFSAPNPLSGDKEKGERYGKALRTGNLQQQAQGLGINEFAAPEIGEGYTIYGIQAGVDLKGNALDYASGDGITPVPLPRTWGYHFAGVVASSEDGKDKVTLENYNRAADIEDELQKVYQDFVDKHQEGVEEAIKDFKHDPSIPFRAFFRLAYLALNATLSDSMVSLEDKKEEAKEAYGRLMNKRNDGQAWFFQLYGSGKGQTFHERQYATGTIANPMTVRVGRTPDNVSAQRTILVNKLQNIPAPVPGTLDHNYYLEIKAEAIQQILGRTQVPEINGIFNDTLKTLVQRRLDTHINHAKAIALEEDIIAPGKGYDENTIFTLRQSMQQAYDDLSFVEIFKEKRLKQKIAQLQLLYQKAVALANYVGQNLEV